VCGTHRKLLEDSGDLDWAVPRSGCRPAGRSSSVASLTPAQQSHNASRRRGSHRWGAKLLCCLCVVGALAVGKAAGTTGLTVDTFEVMNGLGMTTAALMLPVCARHCEMLPRAATGEWATSWADSRGICSLENYKDCETAFC
jgi:hypothetical protein